MKEQQVTDFQSSEVAKKPALQVSVATPLEGVRAAKKRIWIDLDNSPHVPFFLPIIEQLKKRGYEVVLTARDSYQVRELLKFHGLDCRVIGGHWGKHRILKIVGTCWRVGQLLPVILKEKPDLAVSHGSRGQIMTAFALRIPSVAIYDYEFTAKLGSIHPTWTMFPDLVPMPESAEERKHAIQYPGLKEDVYIRQLKIDPSLKRQLGITENELVVTIRPPATEAHYHNPEAEILLDAALNRLVEQPEVRVILLPRNQGQEKALRKSLAQWIANRKIVIPEQVVDGLNLIWLSDLVISGGGTMNREAAALGIPVYSIFRGKIGAIDRYLADEGRLTLIESVADVAAKIRLERRSQLSRVAGESDALKCVVNGIISIAEQRAVPAVS
jgi:predicted glycosyltransferase